MYYAEMKIIIDSVELKEGKDLKVKWKEKRRRERKSRGETKGNR